MILFHTGLKLVRNSEISIGHHYLCCPCNEILFLSMVYDFKNLADVNILASLGVSLLKIRLIC